LDSLVKDEMSVLLKIRYLILKRKNGSLIVIIRWYLRMRLVKMLKYLSYN
jgi:hypothetical protein